MTYTTTPQPDATLKALRTRLRNQERRLQAITEENTRCRAQVEKLQSLVADMSDLRKRWKA